MIAVRGTWAIRWVVVSVVLSVAGAAGAQRGGFVLASTRAVGMGGAGVAVAGADNAVFLNPALLGVGGASRVALLELQARVDQNTFEQYGFYRDHGEEFQNLDRMTDPERNRFYQEMLGVARNETVLGFTGAAPIALTGPGYSFGVYERAVVDYDVREGASSVPMVQADAVADGQIVAGAGRKVASFFVGDLYLGANVKYLYRAVTSVTRTAPAVDTIDDVRVYRGSAFAFDAGLLFQAGRWSLGGGFYDVNWPWIRWSAGADAPEGLTAPDDRIDGSMRLGMSYRPDLEVAGLVDHLQVAVDVESPLSHRIGTFKKISAGGECRFARAVVLRAGLHQGYPTAGAGVLLRIVKVEYAFGGEALGRYPGQMDSWHHYVTVGLGWGY